MRLLVWFQQMNLQWIYHLKIGEKFSMAVGRFINSNLKVASDANDATAVVFWQRQ
jgi:hypothetical protein